MSFTCPLCHQPLTQINNSVICPQRHQFDVAKEGYINLLPVQHKRSRDPRQRRNDAGEESFDGATPALRDAVINLLRERLDQSATAILDIGCGEGYYTHALPRRCRESPRLDWTLQNGDQSGGETLFAGEALCVASSHRLPFADASMDAVIRIYAPKAQELARGETRGWVVTTPWPHHLMELKGLIYDEVCVYMRRIPSSSTDSHCSRVPALLITCSSPPAAVALLQMTPFVGAPGQTCGNNWLPAPDLAADGFQPSSSGSVTVNCENASRGSDANSYQYDPAENFSTLTQHWGR